MCVVLQRRARPLLVVGRDDRAEACAVDKAHALEVDHDFWWAVLHCGRDRIFEGGSAGHVQASGRGQHCHARVGLPCLDIEAHWWQAYSERVEVSPL